MPQTEIICARPDKVDLLKCFLELGCSIVPDRHYPTPTYSEYRRIEEIESFVEDEFLFALHEDYRESPLEVRRVEKGGEVIHYVSQRNGSPAVELLIPGEYEGKVTAIPELLLLANRSGFRYLARMFEYLAERNMRPPAGPWETDPDDHEHWCPEQWDPGLSDRVEVRLGTITPENWKLVRRKYNLLAKNKKRGSIFEQYTQLLQEAEKVVERLNRPTQKIPSKGATCSDSGPIPPKRAKAAGRAKVKRQRRPDA